jgi:choline-sulfatase
VFTSDHGDMVGENGIFFKRSLREWSARVPLIAAGPKIANSVVETPVSLVDIFPTILDLTNMGLPTTADDLNLDSSSLVPALTGKSPARDRPVFIESYGEGTVRPIRAVVLGRYKFIYVHGETGQLFDLDSDPEERNNLSGDPKLKTVEADLHALCLKGIDPDRLEEEIVKSQRRRRFVQESLMTGRRTSWDYGPPRDPATLYIRKRDGGGRVDQPFGGGH